MSEDIREQEVLTQGDGNLFHYGSFIPTPVSRSPEGKDDNVNPFELPAPALEGPSQDTTLRRPMDVLRDSLGRLAPDRRSASLSVLPGSATLKNGGPSVRSSLPRRLTGGHLTESPSQLQRFINRAGALGRYHSRSAIGLNSLNNVREREAEFYEFMDSELDKVETFYKLKENQAGERLALLREQLHEMRNRRIQEIAQSIQDEDAGSDGVRRGSDPDRSAGWVAPIKAKFFPPGPNSKAFQAMPHTPHIRGGASRHGDATRDYIRRPETHDVPYRTAKRKLKLALQEFYRGLELLKSYAMVNRTAFRKLNKKFDKAINARPPYRYMNEKVNKSWFVTSDVLEGHIRAVEDLYARYFERGNHKLAVGKLRSLTKKHGDQHGSTFLNGFCIGTGLVFSVQGLIYAVQLLFDEDSKVREESGYLLQLYAGIFLMLLLLSLFCIDCMLWTQHKINYPFIFEFDQRHHLDWRRLAEFPSCFFLMFGVFIWVNFSGYGPDYMYLYYPTILVGLSVLIIFLPFPVMAYRARRWFAYSHVSKSSITESLIG